MTYRVVHGQFWTDDVIRQAPNDAKQVALFLLTGPPTNMIGVFCAPMMQIMDALFSNELEDDTVSDTVFHTLRHRVEEGFRYLIEKGFVQRCPRSHWVWIVNHLKYNPIPNPKAGVAAFNLIKAIPQNTPFYQEVMRSFLDFVDETRGKNERINSQGIRQLIQSHNKRYGMADGMPYQDQDQDQIDSESSTESESHSRTPECERGVGVEGGKAPPAEPSAQPPPARSKARSKILGRGGSPARTPVPDEPTDGMRVLSDCVNPPVDIDQEFPKFRAHYAAEGRLSADWDARWSKWLLNPIEYATRADVSTPATNGQPPGGKGHDPPSGRRGRGNIGRFIADGLTLCRLAKHEALGSRNLLEQEEMRLKIQLQKIFNGEHHTLGVDWGPGWTPDQLFDRLPQFDATADVAA